MRVKQILEEDFVNYKKPAMFIGTASCSGKCCMEANLPFTICQNDELRRRDAINVSDAEICRRYLSNEITSAIVFGGLEPLEQTDEIVHFISMLRENEGCDDDVVIYTGYYPDEVQEETDTLSRFGNIIIKFGRYIPDRPTLYDDVLGVTLASDNQYAVRIS